MYLKKLYFLAIFLISLQSFGQSVLLESAEISILTIGPGTNLNDSFGHSAIRIKNGKEDIVYGYGLYDFDTPNFYTKFVQGKLNYLMSKNEYRQFENTYRYYNRSIKEQVLDLNTQEKNTYYKYILNNYKPENRAYLYDFFYDNCATRIPAVTNNILNNTIKYSTPKNYTPKTFRTLIQDELNRNSWGSFGIDLALGSKIDQLATEKEHMFLPKNVFSFFEVASLNNKPLVKNSKVIFEAKPKTKNTLILLICSPLVICLLLALLIIYRTVKDYKLNIRSRYLDIAILTFTGLIGVLLLLLWFATDHTMTAYNYNLLWAFPFNLLLLKAMLKRKPSIIVSKYYMFLILMLVLTCMHWIVGVQRFAPTLLPIVIALLIRSTFVFWFVKKQVN